MERLSCSIQFVSFDLKVIVTTLLFFTMSACSSPKQEISNVQSDHEKVKVNHKNQVSQPSQFAKKNMVNACKDEENKGWTLKSKPKLDLCQFSTFIYQCKSELDHEVQGAKIDWLIATLVKGGKPPLHYQPSVKEHILNVIWQGSIASEEIPSAHAERIYSRTTLKVNRETFSKQRPCRSFKALRIQRARSFNQVDARESEFDESNDEEFTFEYDPKLGRYVDVTQEEEPKIKVRSH